MDAVIALQQLKTSLQVIRDLAQRNVRAPTYTGRKLISSNNYYFQSQELTWVRRDIPTVPVEILWRLQRKNNKLRASAIVAFLLSKVVEHDLHLHIVHIQIN